MASSASFGPTSPLTHFETVNDALGKGQVFAKTSSMGEICDYIKNNRESIGKDIEVKINIFSETTTGEMKEGITLFKDNEDRSSASMIFEIKIGDQCFYHKTALNLDKGRNSDLFLLTATSALKKTIGAQIEQALGGKEDQGIGKFLDNMKMKIKFKAQSITVKAESQKEKTESAAGDIANLKSKKIETKEFEEIKGKYQLLKAKTPDVKFSQWVYLGPVPQKSSVPQPPTSESSHTWVDGHYRPKPKSVPEESPVSPAPTREKETRETESRSIEEKPEVKSPQVKSSGSQTIEKLKRSVTDLLSKMEAILMAKKGETKDFNEIDKAIKSATTPEAKAAIQPQFMATMKKIMQKGSDPMRGDPFQGKSDLEAAKLINKHIEEAKDRPTFNAQEGTRQGEISHTYGKIQEWLTHLYGEELKTK